MPALIPLERQLRLIAHDATALTDHERVGFELGWDYAHYAVVPPTEHLHPLSPVRQGWDAYLGLDGGFVGMSGEHHFVLVIA